MDTFVDVILPLPLPQQYTYLVTGDAALGVRRGCRVQVPLGRSKSYVAIVMRVHHDKPQGYKVKEILDLLDEEPILLEKQFTLWEWIARYYMCTLGDVYKAAVPQGLKGDFKPKMETRVRLASQWRDPHKIEQWKEKEKRAAKQCALLDKYLELSHFGESSGVETEISKKELMESASSTPAVFNGLLEKGIFEIYTQEVGRLDNRSMEVSHSHELNPYQQQALDEIHSLFASKQVTLLHGVTSSGKTEIYIRLIEETLARGKQVLYLLPEIALTKQITERLQRVFGNRIGIYHSKFSDIQRVEIWNKQLSDTPYDIILGVRSSIFLPFQKLGLVIVDEEHENTYKQQEPAPRYHARNAAVVLASQFGARVLLGTATPSLESYYNATTGKYGLVTLEHRYLSLQLPSVEVVDIKDLRRRKQMEGSFSPPLIEAIEKALAAHQQVILFQNRRGYTPMMECKVCGWVPRCKHCDVALTYHKGIDALTCHYCGYTLPKPLKCPACDESNFVYVGLGTEKIEDEVQQLFPDARLARMDLDTTRSRTSYENIIDSFEAGDTDILIGTQMVSKGLDFDNVAVVGILNADSLLNFPDFRAAERAFQLMAQVSGRAGRKGERGRVILQTKMADSPLIARVVENDYLHFYQSQLDERSLFHYPPFYRLIYIYMRHRDAALLDEAAAQVGERLRSIFGSRVLGPDLPPVARLKQLFIRKIVIKIENSASIYKAGQYLVQVQEEIAAHTRYRSVELFYDVDPM